MSPAQAPALVALAYATAQPLQAVHLRRSLTLLIQPDHQAVLQVRIQACLAPRPLCPGQIVHIQVQAQVVLSQAALHHLYHRQAAALQTIQYLQVPQATASQRAFFHAVHQVAAVQQSQHLAALHPAAYLMSSQRHHLQAVFHRANIAAAEVPHLHHLTCSQPALLPAQCLHQF